MNTKFSWKTLLGFILVLVSIVVGYLSSMPVVDIISVIGIIVGAVTAIYDILMKDEVKGWKCWTFVLCMTVGVTILTVGGMQQSVIEGIVGAVVLILDVIFGYIVVKKSKS